MVAELPEDQSTRRRGLMLVLSSPSGAGKTTISRRLLARHSDISLSISATTRPKRPGETDGIDYFFVAPAKFDDMVAKGEFLEHAVVFGNSYGTPRVPVEAALAQGLDVLFDIDWQGGRQLKAWYPFEALMVWILPPSLQVLRERLQRRATDDPEVIQRRLAGAKSELLHYSLYDYVVVNKDLDSAYDQLKSIYVAAKLEIRRASQDAEALVLQVRESGEV